MTDPKRPPIRLDMPLSGKLRTLAADITAIAANEERSSVILLGGRDADAALEGPPAYYEVAEGELKIVDGDRWCTILDEIGAEPGEVIEVTVRRRLCDVCGRPSHRPDDVPGAAP